jgi:hypothetical protein
LDKVDVDAGNVSVCSRQAGFHRYEAFGGRARGLVGGAFGATSVAIFSMRYALPNPTVPQGDENHFLFPRELSIHAIAGLIALLVGPWQLSVLLRAVAHPASIDGSAAFTSQTFWRPGFLLSF